MFVNKYVVLRVLLQPTLNMYSSSNCTYVHHQKIAAGISYLAFLAFDEIWRGIVDEKIEDF